MRRYEWLISNAVRREIDDIEVELAKTRNQMAAYLKELRYGRKKAARKAAPVAGKKGPGKKAPAEDKRRRSTAGSLLPSGYGELLEDLKTRVRAAQLKAVVAVNRELIHLYWDIGRLIVERQSREGWGTSVIDRLAGDLQKAFPGLQGFSLSNISRTRAFFLAYTRGTENSAQAVPKLDDKNSAQAVPKLDGKNSAQLVPKLKGKKSAQAVPKSAVSKVAQAVRQMSGSHVPAPLAEIP